MLLQIQLPESYLPVLQRLSDTYGSRTAGIKALLDALQHPPGTAPPVDPDAPRRARESAIAGALLKARYDRAWTDAQQVYSRPEDAEYGFSLNASSADALLVSEYRSAQYARRLSVPTLRELQRSKHPQETLLDAVCVVLMRLAPAAYDAYGVNPGEHVAGCYRPRVRPSE